MQLRAEQKLHLSYICKIHAPALLRAQWRLKLIFYRFQW